MEPNLGLPDDLSLPEPWQRTLSLPGDPALPGLETLREYGVAETLPELDLGDLAVELRLCNYVEGSRVTFEARAEGRRFAIKMYADDATLEATLYRKLARVGLASEVGARVPRLLAFDPDLHLLAMSWLDGKTASRLLRESKGERAGKLAASWFSRASNVRVKFAPPCGSGRMLYNAGTSAVGLGTTDPALGSAAKAVARTLLRGPPIERRPGLVHGTLYTRHILDLGDGPGVIDWQQFGQGPLELDAGTFLASLTRTRLRHDSLATEAAKAEEAFLSTTRTLFDERALDWYWAAGLLHVVASGLKDGLKHSAPPEAKALIQIAAQRADRIDQRRGRAAREEEADRPAPVVHDQGTAVAALREHIAHDLSPEHRRLAAAIVDLDDRVDRGHMAVRQAGRPPALAHDSADRRLD